MSAEKLTARVKELSKKKANKSCFDCEKRGTNHINLDVKTFICQSCAGHLRNLPHKCYSISMYSFKKADVEALEAGGNKRAGRRWHAEMPSLESLRVDWADQTSVVDYLKNVYHRKKYYSEHGKRRGRSVVSRGNSVASESPGLGVEDHKKQQQKPAIPPRVRQKSVQEDQKAMQASAAAAPAVASFDDMMSALGDLQFTEVTPQVVPQEPEFVAFASTPEPVSNSAFSAAFSTSPSIPDATPSSRAQHLLTLMGQQNWSPSEMREACTQALQYLSSSRRSSVGEPASSLAAVPPPQLGGGGFLDSIPNDAFMMPSPQQPAAVAPSLPVSTGFMDMAPTAAAAPAISAATDDDDYNPFDDVAPEENTQPSLMNNMNAQPAFGDSMNTTPTFGDNTNNMNIQPAFGGMDTAGGGFGFDPDPAPAPVDQPTPKKDLFADFSW
jgi:hypothetical protein